MSEYFTGSIAPPIIIGASCFSIFWGIINALLVSELNVTTISVS
jgi:hypothetical protein